jgi:hypothetical protein
LLKRLQELKLLKGRSRKAVTFSIVIRMEEQLLCKTSAARGFARN